MAKQKRRAGTADLESWAEADPLGGAEFWVFRCPSGSTVTLAFLDHDDGVSCCEGNDKWGWHLVDEDDGSWDYLGPDDEDRDAFLRRWSRTQEQAGVRASAP